MDEDQQVDAPERPLVVVTPVVDGNIHFYKISALTNSSVQSTSVAVQVQPHFLTKYFDKDTFHFSALINDDHFEAIKSLINSKFYVAATELLCSAIDTFGYLAFGRTHDAFIRYVDTFFDLANIAVSSSELWELRNALLHMTTYDSNKVHQGKISRLILVAGSFPEGSPTASIEGKHLNIVSLYKETVESTVRWGNYLFKAGKAEVDGFLSRYETIISENRVTKFYFDWKPNGT